MWLTLHSSFLTFFRKSILLQHKWNVVQTVVCLTNGNRLNLSIVPYSLESYIHYWKIAYSQFFSGITSEANKYENCKFGFLNLLQYKNMDYFELLIQCTTSQEAFQFFLKVQHLEKNDHIYNGCKRSMAGSKNQLDIYSWPNGPE